MLKICKVKLRLLFFILFSFYTVIGQEEVIFKELCQCIVNEDVSDLKNKEKVNSLVLTCLMNYASNNEEKSKQVYNFIQNVNANKSVFMENFIKNCPELTIKAKETAKSFNNKTIVAKILAIEKKEEIRLEVIDQYENNHILFIPSSFSMKENLQMGKTYQIEYCVTKTKDNAIKKCVQNFKYLE